MSSSSDPHVLEYYQHSHANRYILIGTENTGVITHGNPCVIFPLDYEEKLQFHGYNEHHSVLENPNECIEGYAYFPGHRKEKFTSEEEDKLSRTPSTICLNSTQIVWSQYDGVSVLIEFHAAGIRTFETILEKKFCPDPLELKPADKIYACWDKENKNVEIRSIPLGDLNYCLGIAEHAIKDDNSYSISVCRS